MGSVNKYLDETVLNSGNGKISDILNAENQQCRLRLLEIEQRLPKCIIYALHNESSLLANTPLWNKINIFS